MRKFTGKKLAVLLCLALGVSAFAAFGACGTTDDPKDTTSASVTEYTVTFETNGGSEIDPISVVAGQYAEKPDNPTKAGHIFQGWFLDLEDTESGSFLFDETAITGNMTLYAKWKIRTYNVSYQDEAGNPIAGLDNIVVDWGSTLAKPDETAIAKDGYIVKWYTDNGEIWDFDTNKVTTNTKLTYRYVTTKATYNAAEIAENFYPVLDKTLVGEENCVEHYTEGAESVFYTYRTTNLQQVVLNVELSTLDYGSVTILARPTDTDLDWSKGDAFSQLRAYIKTDIGGNVSYNDEPSSGYDPLFYYIQSTGTNMALCTTKAEGDWMAITFDLASLKFWADATRLDSFAFGFVSPAKGIEIKSVVFNEVDKEAEYTVSFQDKFGNTLADTQTMKWNSFATKPAAPAGDENHVYTGEWVDASGEVFDFENNRVRSNVVLYPQYSITGKYSWTGEEIASDFEAVYNAKTANPSAEVATDGRSIFLYNNNGSGNSLKQVVAKNLNLAIGNYKYLTFKWRVVNYNDYSYVADAGFALIRIYLDTDKGGDVFNKDTEDAASYYINFNKFNYTETTTPIDVSAKYEDGWYTVTVDLSTFAYYAEGTTLEGLAIGTTTGNNTNSIEMGEIAFLTELPVANTKTVSFVDAEGNPIDGIETQTVIVGKAAAMPASAPANGDYAFDYWADEAGNKYNFGAAVTENIVLKPVFATSWVGETITLSGQAIVDNFTSSSERYGNTVDFQHALTLDGSGDAVGDYSAANSHNNKAAANRVITMLNAGIRVHEGSKLVVTFKSSKFAENCTVNLLNLAVAFRGEDPATTIHNKATNMHYFQYKDIAVGTTEGASEEACVSFTVAADGTVTATFDLYAIAQKSAATASAGADLNYIDAFSFMYCEGNGSPGATETTITYYSVQFIDVQQKKLSA